MALIKVGGVDLPAPSSFQTGIQEITKSGRNANGTMIMELIARKIKLEMSWNFLSAADLSKILNAIDTQLFSVTYLDPQTNTYKTGTFYKGDRMAPLYDFVSAVPRYKDFAFNLIER